MPEYRLSLLGGFEVSGSQAPLDLTRKGRGLLAYLALHPTAPQSRDRLADLFWSRSDQEQARTSVRQTLSKLRRALSCARLGEIVTNRDLVALRLSGTILDVERFRELLENGSPEDLEQAVELYRGDLLEGLALEGEPFEEWLRAERESLRMMAIEALDRLARDCLARGELGQCVKFAARLLRFDPLREDIHRVLMRAYAAQGRTGQALKQFETCRETLAGELGVQPELETLALYRQLRDSRFGPRNAGTNGAGAGPVDLAAASEFPEVASASWREGEMAIADKPAVAVLPFENVTGGEDVNYFSVGIAENIITELSKFKELLVVSVKSSIVAGNAGAGIQEIGRCLGVGHIVEGSVARVGDRVRVTARLLDAVSGRQIWSDRYDRLLGDVFAVQDEVAQMIVARLAGTIEEASYSLTLRKFPKDMATYDYILRARHSMRPFSLDGETAARRELDRAIELDPEFADAYACYGLSYMHEYEMPWSPDPGAAIVRAHEFARRALDLDPGSSVAHRVLGHSAHYLGKHELAEQEVERALMLNPIDHSNLCIRSWIMLFSNRQEEALRYLAKERRLNPCSTDNCLFKLGVAYHTSERYQEAIETFNRMRSWDWVRYACLAVGYMQMGEFELARASQKRHTSVVQVEFSGSAHDPVVRWRRYLGDVFKFRERRDAERFLDGLRVAGIPT